MKKRVTISKSKINGKVVEGEAHLQPGINNWIGVFIVKNDLFHKELSKQKSCTVKYEGSFDCRGECINGWGIGKIIHVRNGEKKDTWIINIEGVGKPQLEKELPKSIKFRYNENLPID